MAPKEVPTTADNQSPTTAAPASFPPASSPPAQSKPAAEAGILPASHWQAQPIEEEETNDADSTYSKGENSTASITSSILKYRTFHGRTYHSGIGRAEAWEPNDEQHLESMDLHHHMCWLMLGEKLYTAPIDPDKVKHVLDIGTGTGLWCIDFGDMHPQVEEIIGTDLSPIQQSWCPPSVKWELDDANQNWTFTQKFDFIHIRLMVGTIEDWFKLYREAFRCCAPGGYIEHQDGSFVWRSDNGIPENSAMGQFGKIFWEGGKKFGRSFRVYEDDLQVRGMEAAGFTDIVVKEIKCPLGPWSRDPRWKEVGAICKATIEADVEGYMSYICNEVMGWSQADTLVYCAHLRRQIRDPDLHPYFIRRIVYARKPETVN